MPHGDMTTTWGHHPYSIGLAGMLERLSCATPRAGDCLVASSHASGSGM